MNNEELTTREPTETRIAEGVIRVIATRGFDVVSVRTVAKTCELSAGTVQYHYPTRQALLTAGLMRSLERQQQELLGENHRIGSFDELLTIMRRMLPLEESLSEDATAWVSFVAAASSRPWLKEVVGHALATMQRYLAACIHDPDSSLSPANHLAPDRAARLITALLNGLTLDLLAVPKNTDAALDDLEAGLSLILKRN